MDNKALSMAALSLALSKRVRTSEIVLRNAIVLTKTLLELMFSSIRSSRVYSYVFILKQTYSLINANL